MLTMSRRRALLLGAGAVCAAATAAPGRAMAYETALPTDVTLAQRATVTNIRTVRPIVAMTYDDGPHPSLTPRLLNELKKRRLRATFYLIGRNVVTYPDIVRRIVAEGHEIGNHTWSHPNMARLGDAAMLSQIDRTSEAILDITGRPPVTFRPPYGSFTARQRELLFKARGMPTILWSVDPMDWRRPGSDVVRRRILAASSPGAIILSHDIHSSTITAMPGTFDGLLARGLRFNAMSEMLGQPLWQMQGFRRNASGRMAPTGLPELVALQ